MVTTQISMLNHVIIILVNMWIWLKVEWTRKQMHKQTGLASLKSLFLPLYCHTLYQIIAVLLITCDGALQACYE